GRAGQPPRAAQRDAPGHRARPERGAHALDDAQLTRDNQRQGRLSSLPLLVSTGTRFGSVITMLDLMDQQMEQGDLPSGPFTFRRATLDDIPRLVRLTNAVEAADGTGEGTTEEELRGDITSVGYDLTQDGWVVEAPGDPDTLIGEGYSYHVVNTERAMLGV